MTSNKGVVERYIEGFRRGDHAMVLACLTDDVVWVLPGYRTLSGKAAFDGEIENEGFAGRPKLFIEQLIEEGGTVVAVGGGEATKVDGEVLRFVFSDVFTLRDGLIARLVSYQVNLT